MRARRTTVATLLLAGLLAVLLPGLPAGAAGTGGVELVPPARDGKPASSFRVDRDATQLEFDLVNLVDAPRTVTVYGASASRSEAEAVSIGGVGSLPWLELPQQQVTLAGKQVRHLVAPIRTQDLPDAEEVLGAVVLEVPQGAVNVRVAVLARVVRDGPLPLPLWAVVLAAVLVTGAGAAVVLARRSGRAAGGAGAA